MSEARANELIVRMPRYHPAQQAMKRGEKRFNIACMGRRFGKTKFGVREMGECGLASYPTAWFAPTYKLLDEVWRECITRLGPAIADKNKSEKRIQLISGGTIDFWTLDGEDPARGRKYKKVFVDEAAMVRDLREKWQKAIRPTLTDFRGEAWMFSTPKGAGDFQEFFEYAKDNPNEWSHWQMPTSANPHISPDEIEAARRELPLLVFEQEYLAQFVNFAGAVVKREYLQYADPPPLKDMHITMAADLAISVKDAADFTAVGVMGREIGGMQRTFVLDSQRARLGFHDSMNFIRSMGEKWGPRVIGVENVQYQAAAVQDLLVRTSLPVVAITPDKDKLTRFQPMLARYEQKLIWHSHELPREFETELLSFTGTGNEKKDQVDAISYAFGLLPSIEPMSFATTGARELHEMREAQYAARGWGSIQINNTLGGFSP